MDDAGKRTSVNFLREKCSTKREVIDFVERIESASVEELAQAWRSRSLNTYSVDFLQEKSADTIADYLFSAIDTVTRVETRHRESHSAQDYGEQNPWGEGETMVSGEPNKSSQVGEIFENETDSIFPWIEALRPSKSGMEYTFDFGEVEEEDIVTCDNEGNILSMTPVKWIESLTSGTGKRSPAAIHTFLLTYRAFMAPIVLLRHLVHRFFYPVDASLYTNEELRSKLGPNGAPPLEKECDSMIKGLRKLKLKEEYKVQKIVRLNVISFLRIWITRFYKEDLSMDMNLRQHFEDFFQYMILTKPAGVLTWIRSLKAKLDALVVADASRLKNYSLQSRQAGASTSDTLIRKVESLPEINNVESIKFLSGILARVEALPFKATFTVEELEKTVTAIMGLHLVQLDTKQYRLRWYNRCFFGRDFVNALCNSRYNICAKREAATRLGNHLLRDGLIFPVCDDRCFQDDHLLYRFYNESDQDIRASAGSFRSSMFRDSYVEGSMNDVEAKASVTSNYPASILPVGGVSSKK